MVATSMPLLQNISVKTPNSSVELRFIQRVKETHEKCRDYLKYQELKWVSTKK